MQEAHQKDCRCYYCYIKPSPEWRRERKKAFEISRKTYCAICGKRGEEWHHYKGYEAIWTEKDHHYIVLLCATCHHRCHFRLRDDKKIPLEKKALYKRFLWVKRTYKIRSFRASQLFEWMYEVYSV